MGAYQGAKVMFTIYIVVVASQVYKLVKRHRIVHFTYVQCNSRDKKTRASRF